MAGPAALFDIAQRLERRATGHWDAADDVWADEIVFWRNGSPCEIRLPGQQRNERIKLEIEVLRRAMPDFRMASCVHVLESENLLVEVCTWEGTSIDVPGSAVAGTRHHFKMCFVYTVADGKVVRVECFDDAATGRRWNELMTHTKLLDLA